MDDIVTFSQYITKCHKKGYRVLGSKKANPNVTC